MSYKRPSRRSKYYLPPQIYDNVVTYCRCYPIWLKELQTLPDTSKAITYDQDKVQSSGGYDTTAETALKRVELEHKIDLIRTTAMITNPQMWEWILRYVTEKNVTIDDLVAQGMPCHRNTFSQMKAYFYYLLSKRI